MRLSYPVDSVPVTKIMLCHLKPLPFEEALSAIQSLSHTGGIGERENFGFSCADLPHFGQHPPLAVNLREGAQLGMRLCVEALVLQSICPSCLKLPQCNLTANLNVNNPTTSCSAYEAAHRSQSNGLKRTNLLSITLIHKRCFTILLRCTRADGVVRSLHSR